MAETIKQFGVQWTLLLASFLNFFILLYLMKRFLYKPVLKVLDERRAIIAKSLEDAKQIEEDKRRTEERLAASMRLANEQALKTLEQAKSAAAKAKAELIAEAETQAKQLIARAKEEIGQEREEAAKALRLEAANLITAAMEKITGDSNGARDEKMLKEVLEKIDG